MAKYIMTAEKVFHLKIIDFKVVVNSCRMEPCSTFGKHGVITLFIVKTGKIMTERIKQETIYAEAIE